MLELLPTCTFTQSAQNEILWTLFRQVEWCEVNIIVVHVAMVQSKGFLK